MPLRALHHKLWKADPPTSKAIREALYTDSHGLKPEVSSFTDDITSTLLPLFIKIYFGDNWKKDYLENIDLLISMELPEENPPLSGKSVFVEEIHNSLVQHQSDSIDVHSKSTSQDKSKVLVCHDFKGGYTEDPFTRGYSFEFWHLVDIFIYFSHQRITLPPRGWVNAGHRHGCKVLGTVIFEWAESKPDLAKFLYGEALTVPTEMSASNQLPDNISPTFSTIGAFQLLRLAKHRNFDGFLINIETDLNFLPPASSYPNGTQKERDQDAASLEREKILAGLKKLISPDIQRRKEWRMQLNAKNLASWVSWLREEGKKLVGPQWEIIWYDSVTTAGQLQWQDALTAANSSFFMKSDAIFTNYTWARPPDPSPPGGLDEFHQLPFQVHPSLLTSVQIADALGRSRADVYMGIDVFGRNCYGGYEVYKSLDLIFPPCELFPTRKSDLVPVGPVVRQPNKWKDLGLSVAIFAPGWTWERETNNGGERSWGEWWEDDLLFWSGRKSVPDSTHVSDAEQATAIGAYFDSRERTFIHFPHLLPKLDVQSESHQPTFSKETEPPPFYTNFNRGSGNSWWVCGRKVYDVSGSTDDLLGRLGWTDIGACFPKPDRIWPRLDILYSKSEEVVDPTRLLVLDKASQHSGWVVQADLVEEDAWHGGNSIQIEFVTPPEIMFTGAIPDQQSSTLPLSSTSFVPLCTVNAFHFTFHPSAEYYLEIVLKPLLLPHSITNVRDLQLLPTIIWADNRSNQACSYYSWSYPTSPAVTEELEHGWFRVKLVLKLGIPKGQSNPETVVPVFAFAINLPRSHPDSETGLSSLQIRVGEFYMSVLPRSRAGLSIVSHPRDAVGPSLRVTSDIPVLYRAENSIRWKDVPLSSPTSVWGVLEWDGNFSQSSRSSSTAPDILALMGYFNVYASIRRPTDRTDDHESKSGHIWLGTSTCERNTFSFIVAGLELQIDSSDEAVDVTFCVHPVGVYCLEAPDGHRREDCSHKVILNRKGLLMS